MEIQKLIPPPVETKIPKQEDAKESTKPAIQRVDKSSIGDTFVKEESIITAERNLKPGSESNKSETTANQVPLKSNDTASSNVQKLNPISTNKTNNIIAELSRTKEDVTDIGPDEGA